MSNYDEAVKRDLSLFTARLPAALAPPTSPLLEAAAIDLAAVSRSVSKALGASVQPMTLPVTFVFLLLSLGAAVFCGWMGARPRDYAKPRIVPWQFLMMLSAVGVLVMIVGLLNELGITTGR